MRIFIAGASSAIGSQLVPQLVARGHEVIGTTRSAAKTGAIRQTVTQRAAIDLGVAYPGIPECRLER